MIPLNNITFSTPDIIDYIPFANTAYNIAILCIKLFDAISPQEKDKSSEFYRYACAKDLTRTFIGAIPVIGNIFLGIFDASSPKDPPPIDPQVTKNEDGAKNNIPTQNSSNPPVPPAPKIAPKIEPKIKKEEPPTQQQLLELAQSDFASFASHAYVKEQSLSKDLEFVKRFVHQNGSRHYDWIHEDLQDHHEVVSQLLSQKDPKKLSNVQVQAKLLKVLGKDGKQHLLELFTNEPYGWTLSSLPEQVHRDLDFIDVALQNRCLGSSLQKSEEFILFLLENKCKVPYLDPKKNPLTENPRILEGLSERDPDLLFTIFKEKDWPLSSPLLPENVQKDPKFIDFAVKKKRLGAFEKDHTLLQECLKRNGKNLQHLPQELRSDFSYISLALTQDADAADYVLPKALSQNLRMRSNRSDNQRTKLEWLSRATNLNRSFPFTSLDVKNDPWCVYRAVSKGTTDSIYNRFFTTEAQQKNYPLPEGKSLTDLQSAGFLDTNELLKAVLWDNKTDEEIRDILREKPRLYWCAPESIKKDLAFLSELFKIDPSVLLFSPTQLGEWYSVIILDLIQNPDYDKLFNNKEDPFTLSINREFVTEDVITNYPLLFLFATGDVRENSVLVLHSLNQCSTLYYFLDESIKTDIEFFRQYFGIYYPPESSGFSYSNLLTTLKSANNEMAHQLSEEREVAEKEKYERALKRKELEKKALQEKRDLEASEREMASFKRKIEEEEIKEKAEREKIEEEIRKKDEQVTNRENRLLTRNLRCLIMDFNTKEDYKSKANEPDLIKNARPYLGSLEKALKKYENESSSTNLHADLSKLWTDAHFVSSQPDPNARIPFKKLLLSLHPDKVRNLSKIDQDLCSELYKIFINIKYSMPAIEEKPDSEQKTSSI